MNRIEEIKLKWLRAEAICEGEDGEKAAVSVLQEERKYYVTVNGAVTEEYNSLQSCIYSRYADVFMLLQRELSVMNSCRRNVLREIIKEEKSFACEGRLLRAVNCFGMPGGEEYIASVSHDFTEEIPQYTYLLQEKNGNVTEAYEALYRAEESFFYPVFADLENYMEKQNGEGAE